MATTFKKRQKEAARQQRRQEKEQRRQERKAAGKGAVIEEPEPLPELKLEIGPDGSLVGLTPSESTEEK